MTHISDLKIWVRLTAAISIMLAIAGSAMIFWESYVNRQTAISQAREFSLSMHEATMAGLTGMMLTGTVGQREVFLDQIKQLSVIRDLKVIRGENVSKIFGPGNAKDAGANDDIEKQVLGSGQEFSAVQSDEKGEYLRVVRPALASKNYLGKDCIACHQVPEQTVLGAVSMKISLNHVNEAVAAQRPNRCSPPWSSVFPCWPSSTCSSATSLPVRWTRWWPACATFPVARVTSPGAWKSAARTRSATPPKPSTA
jgi:methyl-accepting chemotaxis protein